MFRITPRLGPDVYDTYGLVRPRETHSRPATCQEVTTPCIAILKRIAAHTMADEIDEDETIICNELHCGPYMHGWQTLIDVSTEIGQKRARYIVDQSGRHWTAKQIGTAVTFTFPAEQQCFSEHRIQIERPSLCTLKRGDFRSYSRPTVIDGNEWMDRFGENQINLKELIERG